MLGNFPPFTTMQELNLDWILTKIKNIMRFVPDDGAVGQILRRTRSGAEWSDEQGAGGSVTSVNGMQGAVVLDYTDVGALPDTYVAPVTSVNGQTGVVVLDADDVGALPDTTVIPDSTSDLVNDAGFVNAAGAAAASPVQSVNGQTGAVSLTIPDSTSDLVNDAGFVNAAGAASAAPVQSVNGQTGAVSIPEPDAYIVESGSSGMWSWFLYNDNTVDLFGTVTKSLSDYASTSFGGLYQFGPFDLPFSLDTGYSMFAGCKIGAGISIIALCNPLSNSRVDVVGQSNGAGSQTCICQLHLHGKKTI